MDYAHYSNESAKFAAEFVNTKGSISGTEYLPDIEAWKAFLEPYGIERSEHLTEDDVVQLRRYRERLRGVWFADEQGAADLVNALLREVAATPQLSNHDGKHWHMHYSEADAPLAKRIAAGAATGLAITIAEQGHERLGVCGADECYDVFVDTSRNKSRRYCNQTCSTKMNVAAYRAREKTRAGHDHHH
jgi:predicted RNA-binding Zn ribbon-like protein